MKHTSRALALAILAGSTCLYGTGEVNTPNPWNTTSLEGKAGWAHLNSTLVELDRTHGQDAPSLDLTFTSKDDIHQVSLKPAELLSVMSVINAASQENWETVTKSLNSATVRYLLPEAATLVDIHEVAKNSTTAQNDKWVTELSSHPAYVKLVFMVQQEITAHAERGEVYVPSLLVSANHQLTKQMTAVEDKLFARWNELEAVQEDLMTPEAVSQLLQSLGRYPRGNREIFDNFMARLSHEKTETLWSSFDKALSTAGKKRADETRQGLVRATYLAIEKARQASTKASNLFVEVFSNSNTRSSQVPANQDISVRYNYDLASGVPHTLWLTVRDQNESVVYEQTFADQVVDKGHHNQTLTLPGIAQAGQYQAVLTIRNAHGHFSEIADSFRVEQDLSTSDKKRLNLLNTLFGSAKQEADEIVQKLTAITERFDELETELLTGMSEIDGTENQIFTDNMTNTPEENIAKWLESGQYEDYEQDIAAFNQDVKESDVMLDDSKTLAARLIELEKLTKPLAEALDDVNIQRGVEIALGSAVGQKAHIADELAVIDREENPEAAPVAAVATTDTTATETTPEASLNVKISVEKTTALTATTTTTTTTTEESDEAAVEFADEVTAEAEVTTATEATTSAADSVVETLETTVAVTESSTAVASIESETVAVAAEAEAAAEAGTTRANTEASASMSSEGIVVGEAEAASKAVDTTVAQDGLSHAILENNLEAAREAISNGADVNNQSLLHSYVGSENLSLETIKFLVENGADIYQADAEGNGLTPMMSLAISASNAPAREEVLRYFLDQGVQFDANALKQVQEKRNTLAGMRKEARKLSKRSSSKKRPYLYDEAISLLKEASKRERS